jgi:hypothetical protein
MARATTREARPPVSTRRMISFVSLGFLALLVVAGCGSESDSGQNSERPAQTTKKKPKPRLADQGELHAVPEEEGRRARPEGAWLEWPPSEAVGSPPSARDGASQRETLTRH